MMFQHCPHTNVTFDFAVTNAKVDRTKILVNLFDLTFPMLYDSAQKYSWFYSRLFKIIITNEYDGPTTIFAIVCSTDPRKFHIKFDKQKWPRSFTEEVV